MSETDAIRLSDIEMRFGETRALAGASLSTAAGEVHAIVGENGSGKSTLAKVMSGVIVPQGGSVSVFGHAPKSPAEAIAAGVSTIFQEIMVAEQLTVYENVFAGVDGFWRTKLPRAEKRRQAREVLQRLANVDIDPDWRVADLPLSLKQWIVIARSLLRQPRLLIIDESSAALDLEATKRLHGEMRRLRDAGSCVVLVTHRIAELVRIADSATVLRDGATVGRLTKSEITEDNLLKLLSATGKSDALQQRETRVEATQRHPILAAKQAKAMPHGSPQDFEVYPGEIVGLAGLDGAGHAEFVALLAGIVQPASGQVLLSDGAGGSRALGSLAEAERGGVTYVSGDRKKEGIFPNLSILENFGLALMDRVAGAGGLLDRKAVGGAFAEEVERLGIKFGRRGDKITTLSGGNQQKVLIARAFARKPKVIVLNDPARGVDVGTKRDLYRHLRSFAAEGGTVIYLSSEIEEFLGFADRVAVFVKGSIFAAFEGEDIDEDRILSALFGRKEHIEFDEANDREVA
ncbi:MAG: sugar ABC transporter ATP-binding protein [Rhodospirillales bacterium]